MLHSDSVALFTNADRYNMMTASAWNDKSDVPAQQDEISRQLMNISALNVLLCVETVGVKN